MPTPEELERLQQLEHHDPEPGLSVVQLAQAQALTRMMWEIDIENLKHSREQVKELSRVIRNLIRTNEVILSGKLEPFDKDEVRKTIQRIQGWAISMLQRYGAETDPRAMAATPEEIVARET